MKTWKKKYEELKNEMSEVKKSYETEKRQILDRMHETEKESIISKVCGADFAFKKPIFCCSTNQTAMEMEQLLKDVKEDLNVKEALNSKLPDILKQADFMSTLLSISKHLGIGFDLILQVCVRIKHNKVLEMQDFRRFSEFGIPLVEKLSDKFTDLTGCATSTQRVFDMIKGKIISFNCIQEVLMDYAKEFEGLSGKIKGVSEPVANMMAENLEWSKRVVELEKRNTELLSATYQDECLSKATEANKTLSLLNKSLKGKVEEFKSDNESLSAKLNEAVMDNTSKTISCHCLSDQRAEDLKLIAKLEGNLAHLRTEIGLEEHCTIIKKNSYNQAIDDVQNRMNKDSYLGAGICDMIEGLKKK